ncbi:hypothetical protein BLKGLAD_70450 (plasmid) [Burkholderia gladioli pv. gladioli]
MHIAPTPTIDETTKVWQNRPNCCRWSFDQVA